MMLDLQTFGDREEAFRTILSSHLSLLEEGLAPQLAQLTQEREVQLLQALDDERERSAGLQEQLDRGAVRVGLEPTPDDLDTLEDDVHQRLSEEEAPVLPPEEPEAPGERVRGAGKAPLLQQRKARPNSRMPTMMPRLLVPEQRSGEVKRLTSMLSCLSTSTSRSRSNVVQGGLGDPPGACECGATLPEGAAFCGVCGKALNNGRRCHKCVRPMAPDSLFCTHCGTRSLAAAPSGQKEFSVLPAWRELAGGRGSLGSYSEVPDRPPRRKSISDTFIMAQTWGLYTGRALHPTSRRRMAWDALTSLMLLYEAVTVPISFLQTDLTPTQKVMTWVTRIFWILDIPLQFCTGFDRKDGEVELRFRKVALRYLRKLFLVDMALVFIDGALFFVDDLQVVGASRSIKILKAVRVLRVLKMVRIIRFARLSNKYVPLWRSFSRSVVATVVFGLARIVLILLIVNHFVACCWCWIGVESDDGGLDSWLISYDSMETTSITGRYAIAFHWSLTQFVGSVDVNPRNSYERIYTICVLVVGFLVMSVVPPMITTLMTQFQAAATENTAPMRQLMDYLYDNGISRELVMRVQRAAIRALRVERQKMPENKVMLLGIVSPGLQTEVKVEIFSPQLLSHPFFKRLSQAYPEAFQAVCHRAVARFTVPAMEYVFEAKDGADCTAMYMVRSGRFCYTCEKAQNVLVNKGDWACEAALWTQWFHRGDMMALEDSVLLKVSAVELQECLNSMHMRRHEPRRYAERFVNQLNDIGFDEVTDIPDPESMNIRQMALEVFPRMTKTRVFQQLPTFL